MIVLYTRDFRVITRGLFKVIKATIRQNKQISIYFGID